jgi:hypothetical protein
VETPPSLLEFFRDLRERDERAQVEGALTRDDWLSELGALMAMLQRWLWPAVTERLVHAELSTIRVSDGPYGDYDAPALKIETPDRRTVWVRPAGVLSVGARGWVDMVCGPYKAILVLNRRGTWKVRVPSAAAAGSRLEVLDERRFTQTLAELLA